MVKRYEGEISGPAKKAEILGKNLAKALYEEGWQTYCGCSHRGRNHKMTGMVYLIGAGPGDVKLITVKGRECIEKADVIVYDYLADAHLLEWARPDAELIYAGKQCKDHTMHQWEINELLVQKGKEGKIVARLKGRRPTRIRSRWRRGYGPWGSRCTI